MKNTKYQELLKKTKESQYLLMEIPHYNEDLYQQYESMIDELEDFASREIELFQELYVNENEFIDSMENHFRDQLGETNLSQRIKEEMISSYGKRVSEYYKVFDRIQHEEIYKMINDPEIEDFYPLDRFFEATDFHKK